MPDSVLIFSAESIRGQILLNALQQKGYDVRLYDKTINAEKIISTAHPSVIILDAKSFYSKELEFFLSARAFLSDSRLILLTALNQGIPVEFINTRVDACLSEPLDVNLVLVKVREFLSDKEATSQASAEEKDVPVPGQPADTPGDSQEKPSAQEQNTNEEPRPHEKPPSEGRSPEDDDKLEEDLKRLLDLE